MTGPGERTVARDAYREQAHDIDCLTGVTPVASCRCARSEWLAESVPRWQARAELLAKISRWSSEHTAAAEGYRPPSGTPVPQAEAQRAIHRLSAAMYIEFGNTARLLLDECEKARAAAEGLAAAVEVKEPTAVSGKPRRVLTVELPVGDVAGGADGGEGRA